MFVSKGKEGGMCEGGTAGNTDHERAGLGLEFFGERDFGSDAAGIRREQVGGGGERHLFSKTGTSGNCCPGLMKARGEVEKARTQGRVRIERSIVGWRRDGGWGVMRADRGEFYLSPDCGSCESFPAWQAGGIAGLFWRLHTMGLQLST